MVCDNVANIHTSRKIGIYSVNSMGRCVTVCTATGCISILKTLSLWGVTGDRLHLMTRGRSIFQVFAIFSGSFPVF